MDNLNFLVYNPVKVTLVCNNLSTELIKDKVTKFKIIKSNSKHYLLRLTSLAHLNWEKKVETIFDDNIL